MARGDRAHITFTAELWLWPAAKTSWHFITLTPAAADQVRFYVGGGKRRGWGSVPVAVTVGNTCWRTSIFPDKTSKSFLLPIKADVRRAEKLKVGGTAKVTLVLTNV